MLIKNHLLRNKIQEIENRECFPFLVAWIKISNNMASDGNRVNVGNFDSNGLNVNNYWDDNRNNNLGLVSSKESFDQTIQSYSGVLKHCEGWKIEKKIKIIIGD